MFPNKVKQKKRVKLVLLLICLVLSSYIVILTYNTRSIKRYSVPVVSNTSSFNKNTNMKEVVTDQNINPIYLGDLTPLESKVNWWGLKVGDYPEGYPIKVKGKECKEFLVTHAPASVSYAIPNGVKSFSFYGVVPDNPGLFGAWFHEVKIDGVSVFKSRALLVYESKEFYSKILLPDGAKEIQLIVDSIGDAHADHAIWAYPNFD